MEDINYLIGRDDGYDDGYKDGCEKTAGEFYHKGYKDGYEVAEIREYDKGYKNGYENGIIEGKRLMAKLLIDGIKEHFGVDISAEVGLDV